MTKPPVYINSDTPTDTPAELVECFQIWDAKRGDRFAPSWSELDFFAFPINMIPYCYLVDVRRGAEERPDFCFRFIGAAVNIVEGRNYTGKFVDDLLPPELAPVVRAQYEAFTARAKPVFFRIEKLEMAPIKSDKQIYDGVRLPLSSDGLTMDQFIVFSSFERDPKGLKINFDDLVASYGNYEPAA